MLQTGAYGPVYRPGKADERKAHADGGAAPDRNNSGMYSLGEAKNFIQELKTRVVSKGLSAVLLLGGRYLAWLCLSMLIIRELCL